MEVEKIIENEICNRCKSKNSRITDYNSGNEVCNECGLVFEDTIIDDEDEKRTFENDDGENKIHRVGPPENPIFGKELGTNLIIRENGKTRFIRSYSKSNNLLRNFWKIQKLLSSADVPKKMIEETKELYDKLSKSQNMRGKNLNLIILALYYYVCRKEQCAKTFKEISLMFNMFMVRGRRITERDIKKIFNKIKNDIVESLTGDDLIEIEKNYIRTYIGPYQSKYNWKKLSFEIVENINKNELLEGKNPKTIAGLALFLSSKLLNDNLLDQKELFSNFSQENTLKKSYDEIKPFLNVVIPDRFADKISYFLENSLFSSF